MSLAQLGLAGAVLLVIVLYAALAARFTAAGSRWAATLPRPSWQPPDVVFGVIWPLNFVALAVAGIAVTLQSPLRDALLWLGLFAASVALALGWAHAFYRSHHLGRAALMLCGAAALTWLLVIATGRLVGWAGWVLVPYAGWLTVASSLAIAYDRLTRPVVTTS